MTSGDGIKKCLDKDNAIKRDIALALGQHVSVLTRTVGIWRDAAGLSSLGFTGPHDIVDDEEEVLAMEKKLCAHWFVWNRKVVDARHGSLGTWERAYPHHFVALLSPDIATK